MKTHSIPALAAALLLPLCASAADDAKSAVLKSIDATAPATGKMALQIWNLAELGYQEAQSSALLQKYLGDAGFTVESGVAGIPTAFTATYGSGHPVIAILGEFDALPGMSQAAVPEHKKLDEHAAAGHACGHHLFGAGSAQAAVAIKAWMQTAGQTGTLRFYGTPAEEGGSGKVYMVRAGLFNDVDAVLHWHPADRNAVQTASTLANKSAKFRFHGQASHAAAAPERGRSALDAVEAMDYMANLLREHVPDTTRIHYIITRGGDAPNIVPAFAEVFYYVRTPTYQGNAAIWERLEKTALAAALGTGTEVDWEIIHGNYNILPNDTLSRVMHENLVRSAGITYDADETAFAEKIGPALPGGQHASLELASTVAPLLLGDAGGRIPGSTDVGDVSWTAPTVGVSVATWVPGTPAHSWQAVAAGGTTIGLKGMNVAAKTLALTAIDLFTQPGTLAAARAEFEDKRGPGFKYAPLLGDRAPPLDYRN